jgi:hypothetical protein
MLVLSTLLRDIFTPFIIGDKDGQIPETFANMVLIFFHRNIVNNHTIYS